MVFSEEVTSAVCSGWLSVLWLDGVHMGREMVQVVLREDVTTMVCPVSVLVFWLGTHDGRGRVHAMFREDVITIVPAVPVGVHIERVVTAVPV